MNHYRIWLDGGSHRNGSNNSVGYGSYYFQNVRKNKTALKRMKHGTGITSNEAEWQTLINVLEMLMDAYNAEVELYMDSKLVVNQFNKKWRCKDKRMLKYRNTAHRLKSQLEKKKVIVELSWIPRENIEIVLGH